MRAFDPEGVEQAKLVLTNVEYASDPYDCLTGADVAVLVDRMGRLFARSTWTG